MKFGTRTFCRSLGTLILLLPALASQAETTLTNQFLRVVANPQNGSITVTDLRNGLDWHQALLETNGLFRQRVASTDPKQQKILFNCELAGVARDGKTRPVKFSVAARLHATKPDLELTFTFADQGEWRQAAYPYNFHNDGDQTYNLYPHGEGMLVPVRRKHPDWIELPSDFLYGGTLSYLMCLGLVDLNSGAGLISLFPSIESTKVQWRNVPGEAGAVVVPQIVWNANKYRFDRPYTIICSFSDQGGYVALAQHYRTFFADQGMHKTLKEKAAVNPAVNEIAGAPVFWSAGKTTDEVRAAADILKSNGVDRCLFAMPVLFAPQSFYTNKSELAEVMRYVRSLGYHTYRYDQFRDAFRLDPALGVHFQVNTEAWPDMIVRQENGKMVQAFGTNSGVICSKFFMPLARKHLPDEFATFGYSAWFLDCIGSVTFNFEGECWDSRHPCSTFDTRREREALLRFVNDHGRLTGTECGLDYTIPYVHWFEGAATLVRWVDSIPPSEIHENSGINDSRVSEHKKILAEMESLKPTDTPRYTVDLDTKYRIPFYSLVHHDEVIVTWRWEHGMNNPPVYWKRKNLWSVLYGAPPMYRQYLEDTKRWQQQIGQTQRYVSEWVRQIAFDEMVNHRFVTSDHGVQETLFSSGHGVVVNFTAANVTLADGQTVSANDYVCFKVENGRRNYEATHEKNVFAP